MGMLNNYFRYHLGSVLRKYRNNIDRKRYEAMCYEIESNPTIISQNCIGGIIYHDLGLKFNSPTINLFMDSDDYIRFLERLDYYLQIDANTIHFVQDNPYPIGYLEDIKIHFVHYTSKEQVVEQWNRRRKRVDRDNIYLIMTDRDKCSESIFQRYLSLKYRNKVFFSHNKREGDCVVYMPCFAQEEQVGSLTDFCSIWGKRYYEKYFDYVKWLCENGMRE